MEAVGLLRAEVLPLPPLGPPPSDVLVSPGSWPLSFEGDLIAAAGDSSQDLTVLHDLRLLVVFRGRSPRASRVYLRILPSARYGVRDAVGRPAVRGRVRDARGRSGVMGRWRPGRLFSRCL